MKSYLYLSALAALTLASCSDNEVIEAIQTPTGNTDGRISFVQRTENSTRAGSQQAQNAGHYEFGVWAMKGSTLADYSATTNGVMGNYLVAYTDGTTSGINNWYKDIKSGATTWGKDANGEVTDAATGVSSWFYEGITSANHATYTTPDVNQILKYWDQSAANHYFFAYMPYNKTTAETTYNADQIAFSYDGTNGGKYVFTNLSSFYTSPVTGKQVATAAAKTVTSPGDKAYTDDKEIANDNEALYAYTAVPKAQYGEDVPLEFKHINAKVNIAFYEVIKGYKVKLIDVVPQSAVDANAKITAVVPGVQFSPSTDNQGRQPMTVKQTIDLPTYYEAANVTATHVEATTATLALTGTADKKNLVFAATNATGTSIGGETEYIGETSSSNKTLSATTLYVLPNHDGTNYITAAHSATTEYEDYGGASTKTTSTNVADQTGYTLHVSYQLIPEDGTAKTTVYDARVHVDAQYCKWQAGKAYTYIFKITDQTNGTTDPTTVDPETATTTPEPWIDPKDPRVPDDPALVPIVFDGVTVTDYDAATTGKTGDTDEWVITDPASWASFGVTYRYSPAALAKSELTTTLGTAWTTATTTVAGITDANCSFDGETRVFTLGNGTNTFMWKATVQEVVTLTFAPKYGAVGSETVISDATVPEPTLYSYSLYVWEQDAASSATKYTAAPTGEVVYKTRTEIAKMKDSSDAILYKKSVAENGGSPTVTWHTDEACTSAYGGDASAYTTLASSAITYTNPTVTFGSVTSAAASPVPAKAYAVVKVK